MNDVLRQRLIGGAVLVAVALLVTLILPNARQPASLDDGVRVAEMSIRPLDDGYGGSQRPATPTSALPATEESYASSAGPQEATALPGNPYALLPSAAGSADAPASSTASVPLPPPEPDVETQSRAVPATASVAPAAASALAPAAKSTAPPPASTTAVASKPTVAPAPAPAKPAPAPAPKPAVTSAAKPAATTGAWRIQAGAYSSVDNARRAQGQIEALGLKAQLAPIESGGQVLYRVSSGPYADRAAAEAAARRMTGKGIQTRVYQE